MVDPTRLIQQSPHEESWQHFHRGIPGLNKCGATIPPFGLVQFDKDYASELEVEDDDLEFGPLMPLKKIVNSQIAIYNHGKLFFNGPYEILDGAPGRFFWNQPCIALMDATYTEGTYVGPVSGQFYMKDTGGTHQVLFPLADAEPSTSKPLAWVMPLASEIGFFKTPSGGIAAKNSGTGVFGSAVCDRYRIEKTGTNSYKYTLCQDGSTTITERVFNDMSSAIGGTKFIKCKRHSGIFLPYTEDC